MHRMHGCAMCSEVYVCLFGPLRGHKSNCTSSTLCNRIYISIMSVFQITTLVSNYAPFFKLRTFFQITSLFSIYVLVSNYDPCFKLRPLFQITTLVSNYVPCFKLRPLFQIMTLVSNYVP